MNIISVLGARPQFIKAATVSRVIANSDAIQEKIVHTGQHFDFNMSGSFFEELNIPHPTYQLELSGSTHGAMTAGMIKDVEEILLKEKTDVVLVYGDTNSTLAGALAASKLNIAVAHVEAGLRSFNMRMPEEVNRILTDRISSILFCPTDTAIKNLKIEGFDSFDTKVVKSGDVMLDAALYYADRANEKSTILEKENIASSEFVLSTIHRAENTDNLDRLRSILSALEEINQEIPVILPIHPRTRKTMEKNGIKSNLRLIDPVGYYDMIALLQRCSLVLTDSGGLQKEAFFFEKPCITMRDETEWTELVEHGYNIVVGADGDKILQAYNHFQNNTVNFTHQLYGDGKAAEKIVDELMLVK